MTNVRYGHSAFGSAATTETATIKAGSEVGFRIKEFRDTRSSNGVFYLGPAQVYMSRRIWRGMRGVREWFKIYYLGLDSNGTWATDRVTQVCVVVRWRGKVGLLISRSILRFRRGHILELVSLAPAVCYMRLLTRTITDLLRLELPFPIKDWPGHSQWYVNCAQVNIVGGGRGTPGPTIKIPDDYSSFNEVIGLTTDGVEFNSGLDKYVPPDPKLWTG